MTLFDVLDRFLPPDFLGAGLATLPNGIVCVVVMFKSSNDAYVFAGHHGFFDLHEVEFYPWATSVLLDIIDRAVDRSTKEG